MVLLFTFLPVTVIAQTPELQAQERLEDIQEVERIDPLDVADRELEEAQQPQAPVEVRCECVCPQNQTPPASENPPVSGNVRMEIPLDQEREEEQTDQQTTAPPGQNNSQFVDPVEQQMRRN